VSDVEADLEHGDEHQITPLELLTDVANCRFESEGEEA